MKLFTRTLLVSIRSVFKRDDMYRLNGCKPAQPLSVANDPVNTAIVSPTGKTRFRAGLERAAAGGRPCIGQWMEFPGFSLAKTIAALGEDVSEPEPPSYTFLPHASRGLTMTLDGTVGPYRLRARQHSR